MTISSTSTSTGCSIEYYRRTNRARHITFASRCREKRASAEPSLIRTLTVANLYEALEREYRTEKCKSLYDLQTSWKLHLEPFFGFMRPVNVSTDLVNRYVDKRQQEGARDATINRELAVLKRAFHLGRECTPPKVHNLLYIKMLKENKNNEGREVTMTPLLRQLPARGKGNRTHKIPSTWENRLKMTLGKE